MPLIRPSFPLFVACATFFLATPDVRSAGVPQPTAVWRVEELRRGMKGHGRTVLQGTRLESFQVEILGILKNTSPGRDLILARLSGIGLEKTGVIAGMSGSPVYIEGKLAGAIAYAWPFGKEPIAGITPFSQMQGFVETLEHREAGGGGTPVRVGRGFGGGTPPTLPGFGGGTPPTLLEDSIRVAGRDFDRVTVAQGHD